MGAHQSFAKICGSAVLIAFSLTSGGEAVQAQPLPARGHAGCYAKMAYPPAYRTVSTRIAGPPVITFRDIPAVVQHDSKQILVTSGRTEHQTIAPVYKTVSHWVVTPGAMRVVRNSPVFRTYDERRLISPARLVWRSGGVARGFTSDGGYGQGGGVQARPTGEVMCRVLIPARYGWVRRRVLVTPASETTVQAPPHRTQVQERVLVQAGRTEDHVIAPVYRTVDVARIITPASRQRVVSAGPSHLVYHRALVRPARFAWAPIVCVPGPGPRAVQPPASAEGYGAQSYGDALPSRPQTYGGPYSGAASPRRPYRHDESAPPAAPYPSTPAPSNAPYDVGHPAH